MLTQRNILEFQATRDAVKHDFTLQLLNWYEKLCEQMDSETFRSAELNIDCNQFVESIIESVTGIVAKTPEPPPTT